MVPGASTSEVVNTSDSYRGWHNGAQVASLLQFRMFAWDERADAGLPTVAINVSDRVQELASEILNRSDASFDAAEPVAELAKQHFFERGFTHFAFVGVEEVVWSERREESFRKQLASSGHELLAYRQPARERDLAWVKEQVMLADWLRKLPTPIGILACNDEHGRMVLDCCRMAELQVPEQVAVLGVDNDEFFCNLAEPPLSSIALVLKTRATKWPNCSTASCRGRSANRVT